MGSKVQCSYPECTYVQDEEGVGIYPGHRDGCLDLTRAFAPSHDRPLPLSIGVDHDNFAQAPVCDGNRSVRTYGDTSRQNQCFGFVQASGTPDLAPGESRRPGPDAPVCYSLTIGV